MGVRSWCRFLPATCASANSHILSQLRKCEVVLSDDAADLGLVFFENPDSGLLPQLWEICRSTPRVLAVALATDPPPAELCGQLLQAGAADILWWHGSRTIARDIRDRLQRWKRIEDDLRSSMVRDHMVGHSPAWSAVLRELIDIARFSSAPCLLQGESGTGKELAARLIHTLDGRQDQGDLVVVDCSTIVPELSGSEFFGHERGAYTTAINRRDGAFAIVDGGTLFLDEVGELPLSLQAQLLRVIQEGTYKPVGGNEWRKTSFRLVCATNRDLAGDVHRGEFRRDLYYRIAGAVVTLPALRERREDILPLVAHFLGASSSSNVDRELDAAVKAYLLALDYPGNVRELRQIVNRMSQRHAGDGPITLGDLAAADLRPDAGRFSAWHVGVFESCIRRAIFEGVNLKEIGRQATECAIKVALEETQGNLRLAARKLGVTDRALQIRRAVQREIGSAAAAGATGTE